VSTSPPIPPADLGPFLVQSISMIERIFFRTRSLARISHQSSSRGRRDAAVTGCTTRCAKGTSGGRSTQAWLTPRQIGRREYAPTQRAYRRPQQETGEKFGLVLVIGPIPILTYPDSPELSGARSLRRSRHGSTHSSSYGLQSRPASRRICPASAPRILPCGEPMRYAG
jgi:hypothetical protein